MRDCLPEALGYSFEVKSIHRLVFGEVRENRIDSARAELVHIEGTTKGDVHIPLTGSARPFEDRLADREEVAEVVYDFHAVPRLLGVLLGSVSALIVHRVPVSIFALLILAEDVMVGGFEVALIAGGTANNFLHLCGLGNRIATEE